MTRATLNNFVGLFGRQAPIGLTVPNWVTIYVPHWEPEGRTHALLRLLVEGVAVIGSVGCTVVVRVQASRWVEAGLAKAEVELRSFVALSRPYFRVIVANDHAVAEEHESEDGGSIVAGRRILLLDGLANAAMPEFLAGENLIVVDSITSMVGKTDMPVEMCAEVVAALAPKDFRELPHWGDQWSESVLMSVTSLLAINMLAKPDRHPPDVFLFATEYMDEVTKRAFNDRGLRARWRKPTSSREQRQEATNE